MQPSIIGHDQAGISETIEFVLGKYPTAVQRDLAANVFVTGSLASIPGMRERLVCDLRKMRPAGDPIGVTLARDPGGYIFDSILSAVAISRAIFGAFRAIFGSKSYFLPQLCA